MNAPISSSDAGLFAVAEGDSVSAWALSPVDAVYFPGEPAPSSDPQNYRFVNGFVAVGDLPCRVALRKDIATRTVALSTSWPVESLYLPGANRRVEFTQFRHRPTRLSRWCRTELVPPADGDFRFRLSTCGGVHVWVDGVLVVRFEPFIRNTENATEVTLPLKAAGSEIVVLMEEMAERDTNWFFELTSLSAQTLHARLPGAVPQRGSAMLKALADSVRPDGEFVSNGPLTLVFDAPAPEPISIRAEFKPTSHAKGVMLDRTLTLPAGKTRLVLAQGSELPEGYHQLDLTLSVGTALVHRAIACAILHDPEPRRFGPSLAGRKREALEYVADHGEIRMGTALAMLALGRAPDARFRTILDQTLSVIEERQDCSDFVMVPLLWAYKIYGGAFPADIAARTEAAVLGYRYWVDEPGNDVMWFWSENHALCFHVSQLLAGRIFPDQVFSSSGRTGSAQAAVATECLGKWFDAVEEEGLAEWNSAAYYPIDFIGLLALAELAAEPLAGRATALVDRLFTMIALHTLGGVPAGTMGRAYDKELRAGPLTELAPFVTLAFGEGWRNSGVAALPMFAAGRYEPPAGIENYVHPRPGVAITAHYTQGYGEAAHLALYKTANVQLSTNLRARPGAHGHQQHVLDIRFASHPFARVWINHPGEDDPWGHQRPSYWAGNGSMPRAAQYGNVGMLLYDLGETPRLPFTHAYVAAEGIEQRQFRGDWLVLKAGHGLLALRATSPLVAVDRGPGAGREYRAAGNRIGWVAIVAEGEVGAFKAALDAAELAFDAAGRKLALRYPGSAELVLDFHDGLAVGGQPYAFPNLTTEPLIRDASS
jgi:hypothetical protein